MKTLFLSFLILILPSSSFSSQFWKLVPELTKSVSRKKTIMIPKSIMSEQNIIDFSNYIKTKNFKENFTKEEKLLTEEAYLFLKDTDFNPKNTRHFKILEEQMNKGEKEPIFSAVQFQSFYYESIIAFAGLQQKNEKIAKKFKEDIENLSFLVFEPEIEYKIEYKNFS